VKKEVRTICYDSDLQMEAYALEGIVQPFPNHFHEYYVIGYIDAGERSLSCKNQKTILHKGDVILFNPEDNHACSQSGKEPLHYLGINISKPVMQKQAEEVIGSIILPHFVQTVVSDEELAFCIQQLHENIMTGSGEFEKEEWMLSMMSILLQRHCEPVTKEIRDCPKEIEDTCQFMDIHFAEPVTLDQLCAYAGLSKSTLLRSFTANKGITPYRYLQTVRINEAKKLLEQGAELADTAMQTGFSDQSHFTRFFSMFIGVAPGVYRDIFRNQTGGAIYESRT